MGNIETRAIPECKLRIDGGADAIQHRFCKSCGRERISSERMRWCCHCEREGCIVCINAVLASCRDCMRIDWSERDGKH
jgi:hypothetical protein